MTDKRKLRWRQTRGWRASATSALQPRVPRAEPHCAHPGFRALSGAYLGSSRCRPPTTEPHRAKRAMNPCSVQWDTGNGQREKRPALTRPRRGSTRRRAAVALPRHRRRVYPGAPSAARGVVGGDAQQPRQDRVKRHGRGRLEMAATGTSRLLRRASRGISRQAGRPMRDARSRSDPCTGCASLLTASSVLACWAMRSLVLRGLYETRQTSAWHGRRATARVLRTSIAGSLQPMGRDTVGQ